jgi:hypothetical protein
MYYRQSMIFNTHACLTPALCEFKALFDHNKTMDILIPRLPYALSTVNYQVDASF